MGEKYHPLALIKLVDLFSQRLESSGFQFSSRGCPGFGFDLIVEGIPSCQYFTL